MDLDELRTVHRTEREKDSLQHLRDSFYEDVAAYLADLEARRDRAAAEADDPFASPEVRKLTDRIETAEEVSEAIYERRVGKIVKQASFAAADMSADRDGLTQQEADLFDDLVTRIKQNKTTVLDILAGEGDVAGDASDADTSRADTSVSADHSAPASPATSETTADQPADATPARSDDGSSGSGGSTDSRPTDDAAPPGAESGDMLASAMGGESAVDPESSEPDSAGDGAPGVDSAERDAGATGHVSDDGVTGDPAASNAAKTAKSPSTPDSASPADSADRPASDTATTDRQHGETAATGTEARSGDDGDGSRASTTDGDAAQLQRATVRITRDVGAILGVDEREYDLEREDVVTLPATNAEPLIERDAAERLE